MLTAAWATSELQASHSVYSNRLFGPIILVKQANLYLAYIAQAAGLRRTVAAGVTPVAQQTLRQFTGTDMRK